MEEDKTKLLMEKKDSPTTIQLSPQQERQGQCLQKDSGFKSKQDKKKPFFVDFKLQHMKRTKTDHRHVTQTKPMVSSSQ